MSRRGAHVAVACALLLAARVAHADEDATAINHALDESDYPAAQALVNKAIAAGDSAPDEIKELYRLRGVIEGSLGNAAGAKEAFAIALSLDPKLSLPLGMSPKVQRPFDAAKAASSPLKVKAETQPSPAVTLVVVSDPLKLVAKARVTVVVDGKPEQRIDGTGTIALPAGHRLDLRVAVLDARGNRLVEIGSAEVPLVIVTGTSAPSEPRDAPLPPAPKPIAHRTGRPVVLAWWLWGGAAVVAAGTGAGFGIAALVGKSDLEDIAANSPQYTRAQFDAKQDAVKTRLLVSNISYGVAAGCGVVAAILYFTKPSTKERASVTLTPAPTNGGGALVLGGVF